MFEGDSADTGAGKFPFMSKGGRAEGLGCADPRARTPIGLSGNFISNINIGVCFVHVLYRYGVVLNRTRLSYENLCSEMALGLSRTRLS